MKPKLKTSIFWITAFFITVSVVLFQRLTGPTHPLKGSESLGGFLVTYKLARSAETGKPLRVEINAESVFRATLDYRRINSDDPWISKQMEKEGSRFSCAIPSQPPAGKVEYKISIFDGVHAFYINDGESIVARFKGSVPDFILICHIVMMFAGMLFAVRCAFSPWDTVEKSKRLAIWTTSLLLAGGAVFGPIVQKLAFGYYWTGFPFGTDLTDNKTLIIMVIWLSVLPFVKRNRFILPIATLITLALYLIPHSLRGSELDYRSGQHTNVYSFHELKEITNSHWSDVFGLCLFNRVSQQTDQANC